jgi:hypothetical protein
MLATIQLRRKFGPRREEVAGGWRRLHNEELRNLLQCSCTYAAQKTMQIVAL